MITDNADCQLRLECLRLALGNRNRATAEVDNSSEAPEAVVKRAKLYAEFVLATRGRAETAE